MTEADFSITIDHASNLVKLRGEIDMQTAPQLVDCLSGLRGDFVVDCSGVDFMDSTAIRAFLVAHKAFQARNERLTIRNLPVHIRRVFDVTGVLTILNVD